MTCRGCKVGGGPSNNSFSDMSHKEIEYQHGSSSFTDGSEQSLRPTNVPDVNGLSLCDWHGAWLQSCHP